MVGKLGMRIWIYRKFEAEGTSECSKLKEESKVWNTLTGGGTSTASEVFQIIHQRSPPNGDVGEG
jgi:hypothetical protein